ncbi:Coiled-coil domain-containing protein 57 [Channa argus]|uniref:Coiled-coil domain-containing protein 57 n=1 Tax=Channa argus TaxID=215402 RepID=A0A6G1PN60_CHAAH|nr:Coiled-coil domain-containing protein 57 [Channa argus]
MQSEEDTGRGDLETQPAAKEKEWNEHLCVRVRQLESSLKQAKEEYSSLRELYQQLREDFEFNLAILDERDRELERYEVITARAVTVDHSRQKAVKQLRMQVTKLEEQRATVERKEELSKTQHNNAHHRLQLDELKRSMDCEMEKQTAEYKRTKCNLQQRIQELEGELTLQRQEMTASFDSVLKQREHEFNLKIDKMRGVIVSLNLKVKLLSKETKTYYQAYLQATEALKASEELSIQLQTQLHHKDQEIRDLNTMKDNRYEHLARAQMKYDAQLEAQHQSDTRELQKAEEHIAKLHKSMEVLAAQVCRLQEDQHEAMKKKDETIQRLRTEVETIQSGWDNYISHVSSEIVVKDTEIITLQKREREFQAELERKREEIEGYKQQLSSGLKREKALEQMRVQAELESQRHCEDIKAKYYLANEQLIQDLIQARDQAKAEMSETEQKLQDLTVLHSVQTERDQAKQGFTLKRDGVASDEICHLQEQNNLLRAVVTQMRKDMESLNHLLSIRQDQPQASSPQYPGAHATTSITPTAQTTTGPPDQSTNSSSKVRPAGVLHVEKHSKPSPVTEQEVRVEHKESAGLNTLVRQLQKENLHLRHQLALGVMSAGLFRNVQGENGNPPFMHTRLKQAASYIVRLSREKQQLIEMGNRLRAQMTNARLQEPEKLEDLSTKEQGDQDVADNHLSVLEQLQYQLTTQELQHCLRHKVCTVVEDVLPAANPWSQGHKTTDRSESLKNKENIPLICPPQSSLDVGSQPLSSLPRSQLSSGESLQSLKELWEKLEPGLSSAILSEGELSRTEVAESDSAGVQMEVHGIGVPIESRPTTEVQQRMSPHKTPSNTTKASNSRTPGRIVKIRNYNVKD